LTSVSPFVFGARIGVFGPVTRTLNEQSDLWLFEVHNAAENGVATALLPSAAVTRISVH
jgi:hypothetical protein